MLVPSLIIGALLYPSLAWELSFYCDYRQDRRGLAVPIRRKGGFAPLSLKDVADAAAGPDEVVGAHIYVVGAGFAVVVAGPADACEYAPGIRFIDEIAFGLYVAVGVAPVTTVGKAGISGKSVGFYVSEDYLRLY